MWIIHHSSKKEGSAVLGVCSDTHCPLRVFDFSMAHLPKAVAFVDFFSAFFITEANKSTQFSFIYHKSILYSANAKITNQLSRTLSVPLNGKYLVSLEIWYRLYHL